MKDNLVTTVDLLRHGESEGGEIFRGSIDVPLTETGWQQMQSTIDACEETDQGWQQIVSSPKQRCLHFAKELASKNNLPCTVSSDLAEIHFGAWDGMEFSAVEQQYGELFHNYWRDPMTQAPPDAEVMTDFCQRVSQAFWQAVENHKAQHLLLVVHGGVIRALLSEILASEAVSLMRYEVPYACLSRIKIYHEADKHWPQLVFHNR